MSRPFHSPANRRLDLVLYSQTGRVTFITIRSFNYRKPFTVEAINKMIIKTLREEQERLNCQLFTYCLMPDHIHYLISPKRDGCSVLSFTDQFKGKTTNLSWKLGWKGKLWQPRFYDHIIRTEEDLDQISAYILANPVRKGYVDNAQDWPWGGSISELLI